MSVVCSGLICATTYQAGDFKDVEGESDKKEDVPFQTDFWVIDHRRSPRGPQNPANSLPSVLSTRAHAGARGMVVLPRHRLGAERRTSPRVLVARDLHRLAFCRQERQERRPEELLLVLCGSMITATAVGHF